MSVGGQAKFDDGTVLYSIFVARAQRGRLGVHDAVREARFGPEPGTLRRYEDADCKLFPELEQIMIKEQKSRSAAARALAEAGKVAGVGTTESRAKRLAALHKRERDSSR